MIEIFAGRLGGGKTYSAVRRAVDHLAGGHILFTNIELNLPAIAEYFANKYKLSDPTPNVHLLAEETISELHTSIPRGSAESKILVIIDEAHLWLNAREWSTNSKMLMRWLTQSRKFDCDVIFIVQHENNLDKQIVRLVQYIWKFRDMQKFRIEALGIGWPLPQFCQNQFDQDGRTLLRRRFIPKDKKIYGLYNTNAILRPVEINLAKLERVGVKAFKNKKNMKLIWILLALCLGWVAWSYWGRSSSPSSPAVTYSNPGRTHRNERASAYFSDTQELITTQGRYKLGDETADGRVVYVDARRAALVNESKRVTIVHAITQYSAPEKSDVPRTERAIALSQPAAGGGVAGSGPAKAVGSMLMKPVLPVTDPLFSK